MSGVAVSWKKYLTDFPKFPEKNIDYFLFLFVSVFMFVFVARRGVDLNWDLLNYHFYTGYAYWSGRSFDLSAANMQSFFHPGLNVLPYVVLSKLPFPYSSWVILVFQLLSVPALLLIAKELGKSVAWLAEGGGRVLGVMITILSPLWISELGTTFFSSSSAPLVLWGLFFILRDAVRKDTDLVVAGFLLGLAAGLKLTNALYAIASVVSVVVVLWGRPNWLRLFICFGASGVAGALLTVSWYWGLWARWGNPVFPLYNGYFHSKFYADVNFRDMRWVFSGGGDFFRFLWGAVYGTSKTSEVPFADARYIIVLVLLPFAVFVRPSVLRDRVLLAFLGFFFVGAALWTLTLAYQRYFIPAELLMGLVIWILVSRILRGGIRRNFALILIFFVCMVSMKIPDWGHAKMKKGDHGVFDIVLPKEYVDTPARYLVIGVPVSYILPSLHPESHFYGLGLSLGMDELIVKKMQAKSNLPMRILMQSREASNVRSRLQGMGLINSESDLGCSDFRTRVDRYKICEVSNKSLAYREGEAFAEADYSGEDVAQSRGVLWVTGLSDYEPWGRWTNMDVVTWDFGRCLPKGPITVELRGHAYGPNIDQQFSVKVGDAVGNASLSSVDSTVRVLLSNSASCNRTLEISVPKAISPKELGESGDSRRIALGIVNFRILTE